MGAPWIVLKSLRLASSVPLKKTGGFADEYQFSQSRREGGLPPLPEPLRTRLLLVGKLRAFIAKRFASLFSPAVSFQCPA
jgi:hypothetical protein